MPHSLARNAAGERLSMAARRSAGDGGGAVATKSVDATDAAAGQLLFYGDNPV